MAKVRKSGFGAQSVAIFPGELGVATLDVAQPATLTQYRLVRNHPTVKMAMALAKAPISAAQWSVEADDDADEDWVNLIRDQIVARRDEIVSSAVRGRFDYGWAPFEVVYAMTADARVGVEKIKPLLHDITSILIDKSNGDFAGFRQYQTDLAAERALLFTSEVEGCNYYGRSELESARQVYNWWIDANKGAARYDARVAGAAIEVRYPRGKTTKADGSKIDNFEYAKDVATAVETSGRLVLPQPAREHLQELGEGASKLVGWMVGFLGDSSPKQYSFVPRLKYLDTLFVRSLLWPERALLEGQFGTKAEAGEHASFAITRLHEVHRQLVRELNQQLTRRLMALNFGAENQDKVRVVASPLVDEEVAWLREVYRTILTQQHGLLAVIDAIDLDGTMDKLGLPKSEEKVVAKLTDPGMETDKIVDQG